MYDTAPSIVPLISFLTSFKALNIFLTPGGKISRFFLGDGTFPNELIRFLRFILLLRDSSCDAFSSAGAVLNVTVLKLNRSTLVLLKQIRLSLFCRLWRGDK